MYELTFEANSNEEIWELVDKSVKSVYIHKFVPNELLEWWSTDIKISKKITLQNLSVGMMEMDVQTDLKGLKRLIGLNTHNLSFYLFTKPIPDTLALDLLPEDRKFNILQHNGLKHWYYIHYEYLTVGSFDKEFIQNIETHPTFEKRIRERKLFISNQNNTK